MLKYYNVYIIKTNRMLDSDPLFFYKNKKFSGKVMVNMAKGYTKLIFSMGNLHSWIEPAMIIFNIFKKSEYYYVNDVVYNKEHWLQIKKLFNM